MVAREMSDCRVPLVSMALTDLAAMLENLWVAVISLHVSPEWMWRIFWLWIFFMLWMILVMISKYYDKSIIDMSFNIVLKWKSTSCNVALKMHEIILKLYILNILEECKWYYLRLYFFKWVALNSITVFFPSMHQNLFSLFWPQGAPGLKGEAGISGPAGHDGLIGPPGLPGPPVSWSMPFYFIGMLEPYAPLKFSIHHFNKICSM